MIDDKFREQIKLESENRILEAGWEICPWLTPIATPDIRDLDELKNRLSVMNVMIHLNFGLSFDIVARWLKTHNKLAYLTEKEIIMLRRIRQFGLSAFERSYFNHYFDRIWALLWVLCLIDEMPANTPPVKMNQYLPNLETNENNHIIDDIFYMRPVGDLYAMLDYYYRLHWFCVDQSTHGKTVGYPPENRVYQRRKVLEWAYNKQTHWDDLLPSF